MLDSMNQEPDLSPGPAPWKKAGKILLRVALGVVIAVLLLFGVCLAIFQR